MTSFTIVYRFIKHLKQTIKAPSLDEAFEQIKLEAMEAGCSWEIEDPIQVQEAPA